VQEEKISMLQVSNETLSTLIGEIYDCSLNPSGWTTALTRVTQVFDAAYTAISLGDPRNMNASGRMAAFSPWDAMRLRELNETYGVNGVPGLQEVVFGEIDQPKSTLSQMSEESFHESDFFRYWVNPQGLREACVTKFVQTNDRIGIMAQITRNSRKQIDQADRDFIALLSPHIRRACMISDLLDFQRVAVDAYRSALDSLTTPVVLTDAHQKIVYANAAAERLLKSEDILTSRAGQLHVKFANAGRALADAIARTEKAGTALGQRGNGIPLSAPAAPPSIAYVLPLAGSAERSVFGAATAAVFISLTTSVQLPPEAALVALFDLTPTEAKIMCALGTGADQENIAKSIGISINTLKTHTQKIYQKTNINKHVEIAQLVASLGPSFPMTW
jgi:DNA-binding CsgD family transcriptional regulator/PAS domain-containing protein